MQVIDEKLLDQFRRMASCELCAKRRQIYPHHLYRRGMGGGGRIDLPWNIAGVCFDCHADIHTGRIPKSAVIAAICKREGITENQIKQRMIVIRKERDPA